MIDVEPGPFADTPRRELTPAGELITLVPLAEQLAVALAPHHATLDAAHGALLAQSTIDVDALLDGAHADLLTAAIDAAAPIDLSDLNVAAVAYADVAADLVTLATALPPDARQGPPPPFTPPPDAEPPPSPDETPLL